ncbi:hypothetical protein HDG40_001986 [Paraburkholderia sp. JPY158]|uniref:Uncharacterized protein n=1 Tax=Paraburkholderia atlantica TaxID=2654982 RepID=A0A7W8Q4Y1_PARAM|nr:hypothetical protein [Paraburkholderia atlantica]
MKTTIVEKGQRDLSASRHKNVGNGRQTTCQRRELNVRLNPPCKTGH